jgi:hypothetical protein
MKDYRLFALIIFSLLLAFFDAALQISPFNLYLIASSGAIILLMRRDFIQYFALLAVYILFSLYLSTPVFAAPILFASIAVELSSSALKRNSFYCYLSSSVLVLGFGMLISWKFIGIPSLLLALLVMIGIYYFYKYIHE